MSKILDKALRFVPKSGVYPKGFSVGGIHAGVKKNPLALDLALLHNTSPNEAVAAAVFTQNKFKAAPVQVSSKILQQTPKIQSLIVNSGNANAVTGAQGLRDAEKMVQATDAALGNNPHSTLVMSTGVIGNPLPMSPILAGIPRLAALNLGSSHQHWLSCAQAICTTDTFPKLVSKQFQIAGHTYRLAGLAKGAGMICPNMATLLGFFATDAPVSAAALKSLLSHAVDRSFNSISVDGDMLTNDTIVAIANGAAGGPTIENEPSSAAYQALGAEITGFAQQLAQLVVRDGEGATKFIRISVKNALSYSDAKTVALTVANSSLFKTAMFGNDANWGRILCAVGYASVGAESVNTAKTSVSFLPADGTDRLQLLTNGEPELVDEARALQILKQEDLNLEIDLGTAGVEKATFWTCDLSHEYISINADYRS